MHILPDTNTFYPTNAIADSAAITDSPKVEYLVNFTTPATYTVWVRGYADNADADAVNVGLKVNTEVENLVRKNDSTCQLLVAMWILLLSIISRENNELMKATNFSSLKILITLSLSMRVSVKRVSDE